MIFNYWFSIDLALLYKLVCRVLDGTDELKEIVETHIYEMGINAIELVTVTAINVCSILLTFISNLIFRVFRIRKFILKQ